MKKCLSVLAAIVFCALGLASTSDAQMMRGGGPPQFAGVFNPKVGVGAAYEVQTQDGKKTMEMADRGKRNRRWKGRLLVGNGHARSKSGR